MGTNYYLQKDYCKSCKRYERIHIGKSSYGWTFSFRGYSPENYSSEIIKECKTSFDRIISYKHWLGFIKESKFKIIDEYGGKVTVKHFKELVISKDKMNNHAKESYKNAWPDAKDCWLDEDGNSFSRTEFS